MMKSSLDCQVLIAGAGPTGLLLACDLTRRGLSVRIVDPKTGPTTESRALGVHSHTLEILDHFELADQAVAQGLKLGGACFSNGGRQIGEVRLVAPDVRYPFILSLPQSDTEHLLIEWLAGHGVHVEWQTRLVELEDQGDHVRATLELPSSQRQTLSASWLVGCDGAHSDVRTRLGVPFAGQREPEWFALADVKTDWPLRRDRVNVFFHSDGPLAIFPLPADETYRIIAPLIKESADSAPQPSLQRFEQIVERRSGQAVKLRDAIWMSNFRVSRRIVDRYRVGRVFLAGDAAHVHSPVGGQGMNTGLHDVSNLGWKLALVERGQADATLLDSYQQERHPIGVQTLHGTWLATRVVTLRNRLLQRLRDTVVARVSRFGFVGKRIFKAISMLEINYRGSAIVEDLGEQGAGIKRQGLKAGDRALDFELKSRVANVTRLHEVLRTTKHVLLLIDEPCDSSEASSTVEQLAAQYAEIIECYRVCYQKAAMGDGGVPTLAADLSQTGYGTRMVYLIRPDGYIAWRGPIGQLARLEKYLSRWLNPARLASLAAL